MVRVAGRLLMLGSALIMGLLLTAGLIYVVVLILSWLFPNGIGPDDFGLFFTRPSH